MGYKFCVFYGESAYEISDLEYILECLHWLGVCEHNITKSEKLNLRRHGGICPT